MATGILAPPGVTLVESQTWFDNAVTVTNTGGSTTHNGPLTVNSTAKFGTVSLADFNSAVTPSFTGLNAWNFPYADANGVGSAVTTGGSLYVAKISLAAGTVVTNLWFRIATAASGATSGQNFGGLYNSNGTRVAVTGDLTTVIGTNTGAIQAALTTPYVVPAGGGNYYIGFSFNAGTTLPVLGCYINQVTVTTAVVFFGSTTTFGNTAATYPFAINTTGNTTTIPTSLTLSSNTATGAYPFWVATN